MKRGRFPVRVQRGSSLVSIYMTPTRGYALFTVVHHDADGRRNRRVFADYDQARHAADETVLNLAQDRHADADRPGTSLAAS
jgi:hypothetical protein